MGQYHMVVNLDKREYLNPHHLGCGLKLWEQLANGGIGGTGGALIVLLACSNGRGGGDFDTDTNWHGPERGDLSGPGPMPDDYPTIARRTIGRWAGDRIAVVGDYAEDKDLKPRDKASMIYSLCSDPTDIRENVQWLTDQQRMEEAEALVKATPFKDISEDVFRVMQHELDLIVVDDRGWREIRRKGD